MILVQDILVSDEVVEEQFLCNLTACKGACCWEGDAGAPLEDDELAILDRILPDIKPFLTARGIEEIEKQGTFYIDAEDGLPATTLIDGGPCAYINYTEDGIAQCGIEQAWKAGATDFRKPISCQLYPIRVERNEKVDFEALNYHRWDICSAACTAGKKAKLPVYQFLKDAIIRKYGEDFYEELDATAQWMKSKDK
jgi:Fe-S-cluster containining protein